MHVTENVDFHGQSLVASYETFVPFCFVKEDGSVSGIVPSLATEVGKMLNVSIQFVPFRQRDLFGTKLPNGTWIGSFGDIVSGLIHTAVSGYMVTAERANVVDFAGPMAYSVLSLFVKRPGPDDISAQNYFGPFFLTSWVAWHAVWLSLVLVTGKILRNPTIKQGTHWFWDQRLPYWL